MLKRVFESLFTSATGLPGVLWLIVAYMATDVPRGVDGDFVMLLTVMFVGITLQLGMYMLSHRPFMKTDRSPVFLWTMVVVCTLVGLAIVAGAAWDMYVRRHPPARGIDWIPLGLATAMATLQLSSGFGSRLGLIRMRTDYRTRSRMALQASRIIMPVGPFNIDRIIQTVDGLSDRRDAPLPRKLGEFVDEFRVRCDSRYGRVVPWAAGAAVVEAYVQMRSARGTGAVGHVNAKLIEFERNEQLDHVRLRPALVCGLLDVAVAGEAEGSAAPVTVRSFERDGNLVIRIRGVNLARRRVFAAARELNLALESGITLDRFQERGQQALELICPPVPTQSNFDWSTAHPAAVESEVLSTSRYSNGAKISFRSNGLVVRAQRLDMLDIKPTLIEEEYLIMRRLMDASPSFPRVVGCGTKDNIQWLSYQFESGRPLSEWLSEPANQQQWFRVIADVDNIIRTMRDNAIAHRDLNPGNIIVRDDGSLVIIDFDQAVADDERFSTADTDGVANGLGKNDVGMLIERAGLTRKANHAIHTLGEAWRRLLARKTLPHTFMKSPYQFDFAGQTFPGWVPWYEEWQPLAGALGDLQGKKVLNIAGGMGLLDAFLAVAGAEVTSVESEPELLDAARGIAEAAQVNVRFDADAAESIKPGEYDLVVAIGSGLELPRQQGLLDRVKDQSQVLMEVCHSLQQERSQVEDAGWVWRGVAGYSARLCPLVAAAHPQQAEAASWLKVKQVGEAVHA